MGFLMSGVLVACSQAQISSNTSVIVPVGTFNRLHRLRFTPFPTAEGVKCLCVWVC